MIKKNEVTRYQCRSSKVINRFIKYKSVVFIKTLRYVKKNQVDGGRTFKSK